MAVKGIRRQLCHADSVILTLGHLTLDHVGIRCPGHSGVGKTGAGTPALHNPARCVPRWPGWPGPARPVLCCQGGHQSDRCSSLRSAGGLAATPGSGHMSCFDCGATMQLPSAVLSQQPPLRLLHQARLKMGKIPTHSTTAVTSIHFRSKSDFFFFF